ncbi:MAG: hypothetical protein VX467_05410 [Verrucomicrobiota bacterium]|nr:hypothetical protein [Verrucomicrobiota bacterium]MEC8243570.1 hypothetical protein [Verrucomicrobiota bacterium]
MSRFSKSLLLIIPFVVLYFVARSLPVEPCDFLHEETYNLEGELDYCGPGDSGFVDLTVRKWPLSISMRPLGEIKINKPCEFEINLKEFDGSPLAADEIALSHTEKIHLLAVDPSLDDYQHLHPVPDSLFDGIWRFTITPKKFGEYRVFLDLIPIRSPRRVLLSETFTVGGGQAEVSSKQSSLSHQIGERSFTLDVQKNEISGDEYILKLKARNSQGDPLTLKPVMGAHAHLVAFDWERKGFAHLHPLEAEGFIGPVTNSITRDLEFSFNSSRIFSCRLWAQVLLENDENETFIPFSLNLNSLSDETN